MTISWSVSGAGGAAIAVDNPDTYAAYGSDYPASGSLTLPFGCDAGTTTHTYTVWPAGAKNVSKTISASAHSDKLIPPATGPYRSRRHATAHGGSGSRSWLVTWCLGSGCSPWRP